jgi:hypothetical protein
MVGNQLINQYQSNNQQAIQAVSLTLLKLTLPSNEYIRGFYQEAPLLQNEDKYLFPKYLV